MALRRAVLRRQLLGAWRIWMQATLEEQLLDLSILGNHSLVITQGGARRFGHSALLRGLDSHRLQQLLLQPSVYLRLMLGRAWRTWLSQSPQVMAVDGV